MSERALLEAGAIETELEGTALLADPMLNKGTAFTEEERTAFALHGLLPPHIGTLEVSRRPAAFRRCARSEAILIAIFS
jgi:malate dehydrogenase (oxaloacetate-decarboxylating)